jgi:hypothetical protein
LIVIGVGQCRQIYNCVYTVGISQKIRVCADSSF